MYIHEVEMCPYPAEAFKRCDVLSVPVPDAGRFQKYQRLEYILWSLLKRFELELLLILQVQEIIDLYINQKFWQEQEQNTY